MWESSKPEPTTWTAQWTAGDTITATGAVAVTHKATGATTDTTNTVTVSRILTFDAKGETDTVPPSSAVALEHAVTVDTPCLRFASGHTIEGYAGTAAFATAVRRRGSLLMCSDGLAKSDGMGGWSIAIPA